MQLIDLAARSGLDLTVTPRPKGVELASLADPAALRAAVDIYAEQHQDMFGVGVRRDISALWLLQDIAWAHALLAVGFARRARVAAYAARGLRMHLPRDARFAVEAPEDELELQPVTDLSAAYSTGRSYLSRLLAPLIEAFLPELSTGPRAAWACITDAASGVVSGELGPGELDAGVRLFTDRAAGPDDQLLTGTTIIGSPSGPIRRRHGCCLLYAIDGMDLCFSCPRIPIDAR